MARTGSGKTLAYLIPIFQSFLSNPSSSNQALILSPTRELAFQVLKVGKDISRGIKADGKRLSWGVYVGGDAIESQFESLESVPDIMVATPGRFLHLAVEMKLDLHRILTVVYDEADRLFEMGFQVQIQELLSRLPASRKSMLFSATLPTSVTEFAHAGLSNPSLIRLDAEHRINPDLSLHSFRINRSEKDAALLHLLATKIKISQSTSTSNTERVIVFVATKHHVEYVINLLGAVGYSTSYVYGTLDQIARRRHLQDFIDSRTSILVVTDVAARGLDIPMVDHVINYDFPSSPRIFVHRTGRAARGGRQGAAWSLVEKDDLPYFWDLSHFLSNDKPSTLSHIPRLILDDLNELVTSLSVSHSALDELRNVMLRGDAMYRRSRGKATPQGYRSAKETKNASSSSEEPSGDDDPARNSLLQSLISYVPPNPMVTPIIRSAPKTAIPKPSSNAAKSGGRDQQETPKQVQPSSSSLDRYKDEGFYLGNNLLASDEKRSYSLIDTTGSGKGDQLTHLPQKASQLRWNRKQQKGGASDKAGGQAGGAIRTESGSVLPATFDSGRYKKWSSQKGAKITAHQSQSKDRIVRNRKLQSDNRPKGKKGGKSARD